MVLGLFLRELGNWRQDPECIGREHEDVLRVPRHASRSDVVEVGDRIGPPRVLGVGLVQVEATGLGIDGDVLQDGPEPAGRLIDLRLGLVREPDHLGVAAAFEVEDALIAPAQLVVTDEVSVGFGRQGGLARARKTKEHGRVAFSLADVGRGVEAQHALEREQVVHDGEDRFLDLTGVAGAADDDHLPIHVEQDECLAAGVLLVWIGLEVRALDDRVVGLEARQDVGVELSDEHGTCKEVVPGMLGDHPDLDAVVGVGSGITVLDEDVLVLHVRTEPVHDLVEVGG